MRSAQKAAWSWRSSPAPVASRPLDCGLFVTLLHAASARSMQ